MDRINFTMESKLMSVCSKLVLGKYPRDDTVIEKMMSMIESNILNLENLFGCAEFAEFLEQIHLLEKSEKHQAISAVIRLMGLLWKHQSTLCHPLKIFSDEVTLLLMSYLVQDTKTLPKTILHACLCSLTSIFSDGIRAQTKLANDCLPFLKNCLMEESLFVRNAAVNLLTKLTLCALQIVRKAGLSSCVESKEIIKASRVDSFKTASENASQTENNSVGQFSDSVHEANQILECFEKYVRDLNTPNPSSRSAGLVLVLRMCEYLSEQTVYAYIVESLHITEAVTGLMSCLPYGDMVLSLDILSTVIRHRSDGISRSLIQNLISVCEELLTSEKSLETALLATWILVNCPTENGAACSILFATIQSCLKPGSNKTYVRNSVKTLARCFSSVQYVKSHRPELIELLCGLLNPDLGNVTVTSVSQALKVQAAAIDALSHLASDADLADIKSIIHTCVYILRTSELTYQKISKSLNCILKALGELGRIQQSSDRSLNGDILSDSDMSELLYSLLNSTTFQEAPNDTNCFNTCGKASVLAEGQVIVDDSMEVDKKSHDSNAMEMNVVALCLRSTKWEVRDSALEFVGGLAKLAKDMPGLCGWLEKCEFVSLLWYCVEDSEGYVRASALLALQCWLEVDCTRTLLQADLSQETIMTKVMHIAENDNEVFPRRAAVSFLTMVFEQNFWPSAYNPVLQLMSNLIHDSDWDVKLRVLAFWELFINIHTTKMECVSEVPAYAVGLMPDENQYDSPNRSEVLKGFLQTMCDSKATAVLYSGVHDCDPAVQEKAALLVKNLRLICTKHEVYSNSDTCMNAEVYLHGKPVILNEVNLDSLDTVVGFLNWLHGTDIDGLLPANEVTDNTAEGFEALLDDILVALGDSKDTQEAEEEDNNAAAIDCY